MWISGRDARRVSDAASRAGSSTTSAGRAGRISGTVNGNRRCSSTGNEFRYCFPSCRGVLRTVVAAHGAVFGTGRGKECCDFFIQRLPLPREHKGGNSGNDVQGRVPGRGLQALACSSMGIVAGVWCRFGGEDQARVFAAVLFVCKSCGGPEERIQQGTPGGSCRQVPGERKDGRLTQEKGMHAGRVADSRHHRGHCTFSVRHHVAALAQCLKDSRSVGGMVRRGWRNVEAVTGAAEKEALLRGMCSGFFNT